MQYISESVQCRFVNIVITGGSSGAVPVDSVDDNVPAGIPSGEKEDRIALGLTAFKQCRVRIDLVSGVWVLRVCVELLYMY